MMGLEGLRSGQMGGLGQTGGGGAAALIQQLMARRPASPAGGMAMGGPPTGAGLPGGGLERIRALLSSGAAGGMGATGAGSMGAPAGGAAGTYSGGQYRAAAPLSVSRQPGPVELEALYKMLAGRGAPQGAQTMSLGQQMPAGGMGFGGLRAGMY